MLAAKLPLSVTKMISQQPLRAVLLGTSFPQHLFIISGWYPYIDTDYTETRLDCEQELWLVMLANSYFMAGNVLIQHFFLQGDCQHPAQLVTYCLGEKDYLMQHNLLNPIPASISCWFKWIMPQQLQEVQNFKEGVTSLYCVVTPVHCKLCNRRMCRQIQ